MPPVSIKGVVWEEDIKQTHPWENWRTGYAVRRDLGGGVVGCYSHELAHIVFLFGMPIHIMAREVTRCDGIDVEDTVYITMEHENHSFVTIDLSFSAKKKIRRISAQYGTKEIMWDMVTNRIGVIHSSNMQWDYIPARSCRSGYKNWMFKESISNFLNVVRGYNTPFPDVSLGMNVLKIQTGVLKCLKRI